MKFPVIYVSYEQLDHLSKVTKQIQNDLVNANYIYLLFTMCYAKSQLFKQ